MVSQSPVFIEMTWDKDHISIHTYEWVWCQEEASGKPLRKEVPLEGT